MKKPAFYFIFVLFTFVIVSLGFTVQQKVSVIPDSPQTAKIDIPSDVQTLLDRSCLPCHGPDGSGKPKMKWSFEKMDEYSSSKLVSKLAKISEVVSEEDMPPPKKIKKNPDLKLTPEERKVISNWADGLAESTVGGND